MIEEDMKEKYMEYQMIMQQTQEIQKQLQAMHEQEAEVNNVIKGLDEFKEVKGEKEVLFPLSSGIFAKATVKNANELLVNVGSNVVVSKNVDETKELLEMNKEDITKMKVHLTEQIEKMTAKASDIEKQLAEQNV